MVLPTCVSCKGNTKRAKLLKCLHSVCVGCLEKHVTRLNEVRCPECTELTPPLRVGKPQLWSLPDSYAEGASQPGSEQQTSVAYCDECYEDEAAVSKCADCKALLCEFHVSAHSRNRSTHKHRVETIPKTPSAESDAGGEQKLVVQFCILHPSEKVQAFCMTCRELLCGICVSAGGNHDSTHSLMAVQDAADTMRSRVEASVACKSGDGDSSSIVSEAIENVSKAIKGLHSHTEAVSEQVEQFFDGMVKLVKARQAKVLDDLDLLRSAKLLPLEEQKLRLQKSQMSHQTVSSLLRSCTDVFEFVRMAEWLEEAADNANSTAEKDRKPCVVSKLVFSPGAEDNELTAAIGKAGDVLDAVDVDTARSCIQCASSANADEDLSIEVEAVNQSGQALTPEIAAMASLRVVVTLPDDISVECPLATGGDGKRLVSRYRPAVTGKHIVTAKHGNHHLTGSPAEVMVLPQLSFNPGRCHADIQLSNNNKTARRGDGSGWRSVCGDRVYRSGPAEIRVRLDATPDSSVMIFLCNSTNPRLDSYQPDNTAFGWYGNDGRSRSWHGQELGQPWQAGDVIHLLLDCDRHTLTGRHERTGKTETLSNVTGDLYLYISLVNKGYQVTIL